MCLLLKGISVIKIIIYLFIILILLNSYYKVFINLALHPLLGRHCFELRMLQ
jgi:hypothetical protein